MQEIYFSPAYYALCETPSARAECFVCERDRDFVLYPYLKTDLRAALAFPLSENLYDIEGAYGYNGPACSSADPALLQAFGTAFTAHCQDNNIIAEFTRFNPVLANHTWSPHLTPEAANKNVVVDLTRSADELWKVSYRHCVRKNVNKARRHSLVVTLAAGDETTASQRQEFTAIYHATLDKNQAEAHYYFDLSYFESLCRLLPRCCLFAFVMDQDRPIAAELVLLSRETAYSFLGGTLSEGYAVGANNLLKHELILHLKQAGCRQFCLGGGVRMNDGIFRYKSTFAEDGVVDFFVGKKIYLPDAYARLCAQWEQAFPHKVAAFQGYLLKYKR